ncbi:MAG: ABC transporter permease [Treponema sp.]|jgi:NitT/TauT family transport system permease protein/sulfonate transport system permease protein|nr:ABC transporter permease [Treponema sp.]
MKNAPVKAAGTVCRGAGGTVLRRLCAYGVLPLFIILLWAVLSSLGMVNSYLIPSLERIGAAALGLLETGELQRHAGISLARVWGGYGLSVGCALPLALVFHEIPLLRRLFHGVFEIIRAVPPLAMIPLLILWFGLGEASKLAVIVLASFFPVFLNAQGGFTSMDGRWLELSRSLELSFFRHLRSVLIPASLPQILTGLRLGFGYAWRALLGAELFASAAGLGYLITDSQAMARVDRVFVGIIAIGLLGLFFDTLLRLAVRRLEGGIPWP